MSHKESNRCASIGMALVVGFVALAAQPTFSFASDLVVQLFAQANEAPTSKPNNDAGNPNNQAPNTQPPASSQPNEPAAVILKNATQSGVPARCASIADATDRQKCVNTPKGD